MNWQKQSNTKPLFEDIFWNQPINSFRASNLALMGGNITGFKDISEAYNLLQNYLYQQLTIILPDSLKKIFNNHDQHFIFANSNQSGSFSLQSLGLIEELSLNFDVLSLIGNFSNNSETNILLEKIMTKIKKTKVFSNDAIINFLPANLAPNIILIIDFNSLQKLLKSTSFTKAITSNLELMVFCQIIDEFSQQKKISLVTEFDHQLIAFHNHQISLTSHQEKTINYTKLNILSSLFVSNNQNRIFEALTSSIFAYVNPGAARRT
jgi:hypothetical protein